MIPLTASIISLQNVKLHKYNLQHWDTLTLETTEYFPQMEGFQNTGGGASAMLSWVKAFIRNLIIWN